jgi:MOSC domain-containing protein YiiM
VPNLVGRLESINTSRGGVPKSPVFEALLTESGIEGDRQRDLRFHGGPDRAIVLYSLDVIRALQREGHPITVGGAGENLTVAGLEWTAIAPGAVVAIGDVRLLVTKYAGPCEKIAHNFLDDDFTRIAHQRHQGWSRLCARVTAGGLVRVGDVVEVTGVPAEPRSITE